LKKKLQNPTEEESGLRLKKKNHFKKSIIGWWTKIH